MLRLERQRLGQVALEVGLALAGNPVDQVERDVVEAGVAELVHRTADLVRRRAALQDVEQVRLEALRADRDPVDAVRAEECRERGRDGLRIRLDGRLRRGGQRFEEPRERVRAR